jgi:hypothetical protein
MGSFPMSVANNFCDKRLPKYLDSKTVPIYRPHPVYMKYESKFFHCYPKIRRKYFARSEIGNIQLVVSEYFYSSVVNP